MFKPGQLISCCQLRVRLDNCDNPVELEHKVNLLGTKDPHKFFTITCSPQGKHQGSLIRTQVQDHYQTLNSNA